ncbi:Dipeptidyl aminopeptidase-like protein 6, partial [Fragariocoptes setiger]
MVFSALYKLTVKSVLTTLSVLTVVNFLPDTLFHDFPLEPKSRVAPPFEPIQDWNTILSDNAEYIHLNSISGPESIVINNGLLYTGLVDGRLVELDIKAKYKLREVGRMNDSKFCRSMENTPYALQECGRILQLRFKNDTIYAMDAIKGLHSFDIKTGTKTSLLPKLEKRFIGLFNSFAFDPQVPDLVYYTVSTRKWSLGKIVWSIIDHDDSSILVAASLTTQKVVIIMNNLILANGIDIDAKRGQLLLAESGTNRIHKISLDQARQAFEVAKIGQISLVQSELLITLTPGLPDNIHVKGDEALIALPMVRRNGRQLMDHLSEMPRLRKALCRFIYLSGKAFKYVDDNFYKHPLLSSIAFELTSGHINYYVFNSESAVLRYNLVTGQSKILGSDKFAFVSEAVEDDQGNLYLGSFRNPFLRQLTYFLYNNELVHNNAPTYRLARGQINTTRIAHRMDFDNKVGALDDEDLVVGEKEERNWKGIIIALLVISSIGSLIIVSILLTTQNEEDTDSFKLKLELDPIINQQYRVKRFNGHWLSDSEFIYVDDSGSLQLYDARLNRNVKTMLAHSDRTSAHMGSNWAPFKLSPNRRWILFPGDQQLGEPNANARYSVYDIQRRRVDYLDEMLRNVSSSSLASTGNSSSYVVKYAQWGESGASLAFVSDNDIYYVPELAAITVHRLTSNGQRNVIYNGVPDLLYKLSIFTRASGSLNSNNNDDGPLSARSAMWFSTDSSKLAYVEFDDTQVPQTPISVYGSYASDTNIGPTIRYDRYPRAGTLNPRVSVFVVDLKALTLSSIESSDRGEVTMVKVRVKGPNEVERANRENNTYYINHVQWVKPNDNLNNNHNHNVNNHINKQLILMVMWTSRAQNLSLLTQCELDNRRDNTANANEQQQRQQQLSEHEWQCTIATQFSQKIPIMKDTQDIIQSVFNYNNNLITYLALPRPDSDIGDHYHIALLRAGDRYVKFLTHGEYDIDRLLSFDVVTDALYYEARSTCAPERHVYRLCNISSLSERRAECLTCSLVRPATPTNSANVGATVGADSVRGAQSAGRVCGYNHALVAPRGATYVIHECLGPDVPQIMLRHLSTMQVLTTLASNEHIKQLMLHKQMPHERLAVIKMTGRLAYDIHVKLYVPSELDDNKKEKRFPLLIESSDLEQRNVWTKFELDWGKYLSSRKQLVYAKIDCIRSHDLRAQAAPDDSYNNLAHSISATGTTTLGSALSSSEPVFNSKDQVEVLRYLLEAVDDFPYIDRKRIAIWGPTSTASYVALSTMADDDTKSIQCAIALAPITNFLYLDSFTAEHYLGLPANNLKYQQANLLKRSYDFASRKLLIIHGTADQRVLVQHSMQFIKALNDHHGLVGATAHQMQLYPDADHSFHNVKPHLYRTMDGFLDRCFYQKPVTNKATEWKGKNRAQNLKV